MAKKIMSNYPLGIRVIPVARVGFKRTSIGANGFPLYFNVRSWSVQRWAYRPNSFINGRPRTASANALSRFPAR
jgi:hypothetical protein